MYLLYFLTHLLVKRNRVIPRGQDIIKFYNVLSPGIMLKLTLLLIKHLKTYSQLIARSL